MKYSDFIKSIDDLNGEQFMVYYVSPEGHYGACCNLEKFKKLKTKFVYQDCMMIVVHKDTPVYFRKV